MDDSRIFLSLLENFIILYRSRTFTNHLQDSNEIWAESTVKKPVIFVSFFFFKKTVGKGYRNMTRDAPGAKYGAELEVGTDVVSNLGIEQMMAGIKCLPLL